MTDMKPHPTSLTLALVGPVPPPFGGMAKQTEQLAERLVSEGVAVRLIATNPPYPRAWISKIKGLRAAVRLIGYLPRLWRGYREVDCVQVMANSGWSWQLFAAPAIWLAWLRKKPVIVNYRGGEADAYFRRSFRYIKPTLDKADAIVVPSGYLQEVFEKYGVSSQIIANVVDLARFEPKSRLAVQDPASPHIIITRNLEKIYGIDDALKAFERLRKDIPGLRLTIAGDGPERASLEQQSAEWDLADQVRFTGRLDFEQIVALYRTADLLLNPARVDNMPGSLLEAMASGVPIVSTDAGGIPYMVENGRHALLIPVGDSAAMAEKIGMLLSDPVLYQTLAKNGLERVRGNTWAEIGPKWLDLYRTIIETSRTTTRS